MKLKLLVLFAKKVPLESKIVLATLAVLLTLPMVTVVVMASSGIGVVSEALAAVNPVTHEVEVKDASGNIVTKIQATTTWPVCGIVTSEFGTIRAGILGAHTGTDIAANGSVIGDPVTPFMEGTVSQVIDSKVGYGKHIIIDHGYGITSLYGHMSALHASVGQRVKPGDVIGFEGSTGLSTGPHVHFEMRVSGLPVNSRIFMIGNPVPCRR